MNTKEAINLLKEQDIHNIIEFIKNDNLKVVYWKTGEKYGNELYEVWFIGDEHIYDFLNYNLYTKLHWSVIYESLIEAIKQEINYITE